MSQSIQINFLDDIKDIQWYIEDGGRVKRKDGTYFGVDYYPKYFYDARIHLPASINNMPIQWIHFRQISPRTRTHQDKIGMIQISYKFVHYQNDKTFTTWCDPYSINDWLDQNITKGLTGLRIIQPIGIPQNRQTIQKLNEQQREEELEKEYEDYLDDYSDSEDSYYNPYEDYTWSDMIDDAFEGDESNYWNID